MNDYERNTETIRVPKAGEKGWTYNGRPIRILQTVVQWQHTDGDSSDRARVNVAALKCFHGQATGYGFEPTEQRYEAGKTYEIDSPDTQTFKVYEVDDTHAYGVAMYADGSKFATTRAHRNYAAKVVGEV